MQLLNLGAEVATSPSKEPDVNLYFRLLLSMIGVRFRSKLGMWDTSHVSFRVNPADLDVQRHMNNGRYLTLMDLGRMDLMLRSGFWRRVTDQGWYPVIAGQSITYRRSLLLWQKFDLSSRVIGYDDRWIYLEQVFRLGDKVAADAIVRARFLKKTGGSVSIEDVLDLVGPVPEELQVPPWVIAWNEASSQHGRDL